LPDEKTYRNYDLTAELAKATKLGDQARVSQLLQADVSFKFQGQLLIALGIVKGILLTVFPWESILLAFYKKLF
jgi:hypothetical protein